MSSLLRNLEVKDLRVELRRRGAQVSGPKVDLVDRLTMHMLAEGLNPATYQFGVAAAQPRLETYRGEGDLNDKILRIFNCPGCFHTVSPPVHSCPNGHLVCNTCRTRIHECPTCRRQPLARYMPMERVSDYLWLNCPNQGCTERFHPADRDTHQANCTFRLP